MCFICVLVNLILVKKWKQSVKIKSFKNYPKSKMLSGGMIAVLILTGFLSLGGIVTFSGLLGLQASKPLPAPAVLTGCFFTENIDTALAANKTYKVMHSVFYASTNTARMGYRDDSRDFYYSPKVNGDWLNEDVTAGDHAILSVDAAEVVSAIFMTQAATRFIKAAVRYSATNWTITQVATAANTSLTSLFDVTHNSNSTVLFFGLGGILKASRYTDSWAAAVSVDTTVAFADFDAVCATPAAGEASYVTYVDANSGSPVLKVALLPANDTVGASFKHSIETGTFSTDWVQSVYSADLDLLYILVRLDSESLRLYTFNGTDSVHHTIEGFTELSLDPTTIAPGSIRMKMLANGKLFFVYLIDDLAGVTTMRLAMQETVSTWNLNSFVFPDNLMDGFSFGNCTISPRPLEVTVFTNQSIGVTSTVCNADLDEIVQFYTIKPACLEA